jgi:hypothetical protein
MTNRLRFLIAVLVLATACFAQEGFTVQRNGKQKWPGAEAQKIYPSACSVVQREFGGNRSVAPQVTLVLGADKNEVWVSGTRNQGLPNGILTPSRKESFAGL